MFLGGLDFVKVSSNQRLLPHPLPSLASSNTLPVPVMSSLLHFLFYYHLYYFLSLFDYYVFMLLLISSSLRYSATFLLNSWCPKTIRCERSE